MLKIIINNKEPKIESLFLLNDSRLACCSIKGSINIYNIRNNYECDNIINDVSGLLGICQLENNKIVSWDIHSSISIWGNNGDTHYCLNTIPEAHQNIDNSLVVKKIKGKDDYSLDYYFVWKKGRPLPLLEEKFIDFIKESVKLKA